MVCGEERCCVPICTSFPYFCCACTSIAPSAGLWLHGFSTIDVLARLQPGNGHRRVPMVGSGDGDGVYILLLENSAEILFRHRRLAHLLLHAVGELLEYVAVHIADMRDAGGAPVRLERREMSVGAPVQADDGKVQAIVGTEDLAIALGRRSHGQARRPNRKRIEKLTSSNHIHRPHRRPLPLRGQPDKITCHQQ